MQIQIDRVSIVLANLLTYAFVKNIESSHSSKGELAD